MIDLADLAIAKLGAGLVHDRERMFGNGRPQSAELLLVGGLGRVGRLGFAALERRLLDLVGANAVMRRTNVIARVASAMP